MRERAFEMQVAGMGIVQERNSLRRSLSLCEQPVLAGIVLVIIIQIVICVCVLACHGEDALRFRGRGRVCGPNRRFIIRGVIACVGCCRINV